ncbi:MAG TPA: lipopolysaccharide heptosyltransferase II [Pyrinomonadaceae bacterium]|nr:lipopolysaccharide heptosyltransferase II [Pyrinomonadaceae bacterium]
MKRAFKPEEIERVVVRGANWVGDAVMTVPALRELRRVLPGARVTLATRAWAEGVFDGADFLDDLLVVGGDGRGVGSFVRQVSAWRARRFDLAVLLPNAFAPALVAFAARVPLRVGHATDGRAPLLTHPLAVPGWRGKRHEVFYYLNVVAELERALYGSTSVPPGDDAPGELFGTRPAALRGAARAASRAPAPSTDVVVSAERREAARGLLRSRGVGFEHPVVALCPGSTNSRAKRWPAERFAALADLLAERAGAQVLLIGSREELEVSEAVSRLTRRRPVMLTGQTDLAQTVALLSVADLLVTNDTGPAHLAAAVARPVVVIFGPTDPTTTRPFTPLAELVREPPACAPCMLRDCPIDHRCMTAVTPEAVYARAARALERFGAEVAR